MPRFAFYFVALTALSLTLIACSSPEPEEQITTIAGSLPQPPTAEAAALPEETPLPSPATNPASSPYPELTTLEAPSPTPAPNPQGYETVGSNPGHNSSESTEIELDNDVYLPFAGGSLAEPAADPTVPPPIPTVDFAAAREELKAKGQELAFVKTGFHVTLPEDRQVLDEWMIRLDEAGVPFFLKTVDNAEPLFKAQELMRESGVPHVLVYRSTGSVPHYELEPQIAAQHHWTMHRDLFPPELDPGLVWLETLNEPDRTKSEWLAQFALETARLAMADGFRWAAFGWASGEPEPDQWRGPAMQEFLRLAGQNPQQLAIALHEYSYLQDEIGHEYPYKIGRFQTLYEITDQLSIPRPAVLITEWGWEYADIPPVEDALNDLKWASKLYAAYPQVKGAAIWNVGIGCCFGDISQQVQEIIEPLTELALSKYFAVSPDQQPVEPGRFQP